MSSTTRISNYPSVSVPALETALNYFRLAPELDEDTLEHLEPKISPDLLERIRSVLNTPLPLTRLFTYQELPNGSKRERIERAPRQEERLVEKKWRALLACNPPGSDVDDSLKRRARVATIESLFFATSQRFETTPFFQLTTSYLDIQDSGRLGACSTMFNYLTSSSSHWKTLSKTLGLSDIFWPEYSKERVRKNFLMLGRICRAFQFCCSGQALRDVLKKASGMEPPPNTAHWKADRRTFFKVTIKPLLSRITDDCIEQELVVYKKHHTAHSFSWSFYNFSIDYPLSIYDMLAAADCSKTNLFVGLVCSYEYEDRPKLEPFADALADSMDRLTGPDCSLEQFDEDGGLWKLLEGFGWLSPSRFVPIALRLLEKGEDADSCILVGIARQGMVELFAPMLSQYRNRVSLGMGDPNDNDFAAIITALAFSYRPLTAQQILHTIDLLQTHLHPSLPLNWNNESWSSCYSIDELREHDPFLGIAQYRHDALMQKAIALGLKPINAPREVSFGWSLRTLRQDLTLTTALTNFTALSRNPHLDPAYQTIAFLVKYGAKPPENVLDMVEKNSQISFEIKMALKRLFK